MYQVAVIGAGAIATRHVQVLEEMDHLQAVAIADIDIQKARDLAHPLHLQAYADYKQMIDSEQPDIVVITLPHFLHKEAAVWAANQGCHILLEKPMALNNLECDQIIAAARQNKITLLVGHTQRYMGENVKAKEWIENQTLGELVMINDTRHVHYYHSKRPAWFFDKEKAGGGVLTNLGSHSIDKIQWLASSKITKVKASLSYFGQQGDVEGSGVVFLETAKGISATIAQSGYKGVPKNETELIFTGGMIKLQSGKGLWISQNNEEFYQEHIENEKHPFVLQFEDLIACIEEEREPQCSGSYSRTVITVLESIYHSHEQGVEMRVG